MLLGICDTHTYLLIYFLNSTSFQASLLWALLFQLETVNDKIISSIWSLQRRHGYNLHQHLLIPASKACLTGIAFFFNYMLILMFWPTFMSLRRSYVLYQRSYVEYFSQILLAPMPPILTVPMLWRYLLPPMISMSWAYASSWTPLFI